MSGDKRVALEFVWFCIWFMLAPRSSVRKCNVIIFHGVNMSFGFDLFFQMPSAIYRWRQLLCQKKYVCQKGVIPSTSEINLYEKGRGIFLPGNRRLAQRKLPKVAQCVRRARSGEVFFLNLFGNLLGGSSQDL